MASLWGSLEQFVVSIPNPSENGDFADIPPPVLLVVAPMKPLSGHPWEAGFIVCTLG